MGSFLIVGVSSDKLNLEKKKRSPVYVQEDRLRIIASLACVDEVFVEESLELKKTYVLEHSADILVMGDDWQGKFDYLQDHCKVMYLPRTPSISTTAIIEIVSDG